MLTSPKNHTPDRMVLTAAGGVQHEALIKLAEKYFGHLKPSSSSGSAKVSQKPTFVVL
jgi:processing peptidase subunit beta